MRYNRRLSRNNQKKGMQPGYETQQMAREAREAFDDMVKLVLDRRKFECVNIVYGLLHEHSRIYLRSLRE